MSSRVSPNRAYNASRKVNFLPAMSSKSQKTFKTQSTRDTRGTMQNGLKNGKIGSMSKIKSKNFDKNQFKIQTWEETPKQL
jgi:hypothetical protein